jgi:protein MpaA
MVRRLLPLFLALAAAGCVWPWGRRPSAEPRSQAPRRVELGRSVQGRPITALVFDGTAGTILVLGGIHGDETAGSALVELLARRLEAEPAARAGRRVVLIPLANPDGQAARTRTNARGVDLNRNFAAANFRPSASHGPHALSEPETRAVQDALDRYHPSCVISIHAPLGCIDPDGGSRSAALARGMANLGPLPVRDLPAMPGSLGSYAGVRLGLTMVTYELGRRAAPGASLDRHLAPLLLAVRSG